MNGNAVVQHGNACIADLFTGLIISRRPKGNVIGLPSERREGHVLIRWNITIERSTLVELPLEAERIENLHFVATLQINAAVRATLRSCIRHIRQQELQVKLVISISGNYLGADL